MSSKTKWELYFAVLAFFLSAFVLLVITGCAAKTPPSEPFSIWHPFKGTTETVKHLQGVLTFVNIASFVIFLASLAAGWFVTGLSLISRIVTPIAGTITAGTLAGIVALPFLPWIIGITLIGLGGYEGYRWYRSRHATPAQ